ncbi:MAG: SsrA-binding protein SmpB [Endomicrobium sp.]|jgi:SsrA-binding protein|nr:SsrA-binding protein SmpB [Endomicrobium sp.]
MIKKIFSSNKKAYYNYEILEKIETGIVLLGYEVKSVKKCHISLVDGFIRFFMNEAFVENVYIAPYKYVSTHILDYNVKRKRKILMHKIELRKIYLKSKKNGLVIIPLEMYTKKHNGKIKLLIGLARSKKRHDKRETEKQKNLIKEIRMYF